MMLSAIVTALAAISLAIANHDQRPSHAVLHEIVGKTNYVFDAGGKTELIRGEAIGFCIRNCENIIVRNVRLDWERPTMTECRVVGFGKGVTRVAIDRLRYPFIIDSGRLLMTGSGWTNEVHKAKLFDGRTREHLPEVGDIVFNGAARELADGTVELLKDFSGYGVGLKEGDVIVLRPRLRDFPAIVVTESKNVMLEDVVVHDARGMGLIAQHSENVTWRGSKSAAARTSGVFPREGAYASTHADATHFANVKGEVRVENCWFEGMMDDAINVHSTCLPIEKVTGSRTIKCRFAHKQAVGLDLFADGERVRLLRGEDMRVGPELEIVRVNRLNETEVELELAQDLPEGWGVGAAVESADWQPRATFVGNVVCNNRARGAVFATPFPVRVESNLFNRVSGTAILFPGDLKSWFESGACRDVLVRGNVFSNCCTCAKFHGKSFGIITISPNVGDFAKVSEGYHRGITIEENIFANFDFPLLYAAATDGVIFRNNHREINSDYRGAGMPTTIFRKCREVCVDGCSVVGDTPLTAGSQAE